jgi:hypothetical protein
MVKATGLNSMSSRQYSISSLSYKISSKSTIRFKVIKVFLYTHLRSLNVRHVGMAEATILKKLHRGHLEWQYLPTKFNENPPISSKVISGGHARTHIHTHRGW